MTKKSMYKKNRGKQYNLSQKLIKNDSLNSLDQTLHSMDNDSDNHIPSVTQGKTGRYIDTMPAVEKDLREKRNEFMKSILHIKDIKAKRVIAAENLSVQKRTLKLYQRDIDNHCCICGGNHLHHHQRDSNSNNSYHEPFKNEDCKTLKMKKRVFSYLQQSLEESSMRLKDLNDTIQMGKEENTQAGLEMNKSLVSFIECSCAVSHL